MNRETIKGYLEIRGLYTDTDDILISELIRNMELAEVAKADVDENGIRPEGRWMQNPSLHTYNTALKNIISICTKLSLTVQEKQKIKASVDNDDLDDYLDE